MVIGWREGKKGRLKGSQGDVVLYRSECDMGWDEELKDLSQEYF